MARSLELKKPAIMEPMQQPSSRGALLIVVSSCGAARDRQTVEEGPAVEVEVAITRVWRQSTLTGLSGLWRAQVPEQNKTSDGSTLDEAAGQ